VSRNNQDKCLKLVNIVDMKLIKKAIKFSVKDFSDFSSIYLISIDEITPQGISIIKFLLLLSTENHIEIPEDHIKPVVSIF
jgi:hypothetical protein